MKAETPESILKNYLAEIEGELGDMSPRAKNEFLAEIRSHLLDEWETTGEKTPANMLNILERFGEPAEIAAEFKEKEVAPEKPNRSYPPTWLVLVLTALFWPVGIVLAWFSPAWDVKDKVVATLIPIVLFGFIMLGSFAAYYRYVSPEAVQIQQNYIIEETEEKFQNEADPQGGN